MEKFKADIIIFIGLLILPLVALFQTAGQSAIDIQFHDTYFVLDKFSMTVLMMGPFMFLIFLVRGLAGKFKTKGSNIGLIIGLILVALITYQVARIQESFVNETMRLDDAVLTDRRQFIAEAKNRINWTWGLFGLLTVGLLLLTFRTIKIWKQAY